MTSKSFLRMMGGSRRSFLRGGAVTAFAAMSPSAFTRAMSAPPSEAAPAGGPLTIQAVEIFELHGSYQEEAGVNRQAQVNPLDIYDQFRKPPYADKPSGIHTVKTNAKGKASLAAFKRHTRIAVSAAGYLNTAFTKP